VFCTGTVCYFRSRPDPVTFTAPAPVQNSSRYCRVVQSGGLPISSSVWRIRIRLPPSRSCGATPCVRSIQAKCRLEQPFLCIVTPTLRRRSDMSSSRYPEAITCTCASSRCSPEVCQRCVLLFLQNNWAIVDSRLHPGPLLPPGWSVFVYATVIDPCDSLLNHCCVSYCVQK